jgi:hypothetical protein
MALPQVLAAQLDDPQPSADFAARAVAGEFADAQLADYRSFLKRVVGEFLTHPIVQDNPYTRWFARGDVTDDELKRFTVQFSVFSNLFLIAQLQKMINSDSLVAMRQAKEILANEIGVIFTSGRPAPARAAGDKDREGDPELVSTMGTVDRGTFRFQAAHFEWLIAFASHLGLGFNDIGKRRHGSKTTLFFCDELARLYGSDDASTAAGAAFAIENWAAAGFWQELEDGLSTIKRRAIPALPLAFFSWHNRVEAQHAGHTIAELEAAFFEPNFDQERFLQGGRDMLVGLSAFWNGLESERHAAKQQAMMA